MSDPIYTGIVLGAPVACSRPRVTGRRSYYPAAYDGWRRAAAVLLRAQHEGRDPIQGPVTVEVVAIHPRPRRCPAGLRAWWGPGRVVKATRPDIDNIVKAALDALDAAGVLADDGQVVRLVAQDWYAAEDEDPAVVVRVWEVSP
jgi:crossover junction endodeoxyribonuclease RusA